jgi:hypothetical protein
MLMAGGAAILIRFKPEFIGDGQPSPALVGGCENDERSAIRTAIGFRHGLVGIFGDAAVLEAGNTLVTGRANNERAERLHTMARIALPAPISCDFAAEKSVSSVSIAVTPYVS